MQPDSLGVGNLCDAWHEDGYYRALIRRVSRAPGGNKYGVEFPGYDGVYDLPATLVREKREVQGWMVLKTETGGIFFMNETTGETRWKVPEAPMGGIVEEKQKKTTGLVNRMRDTVAQEKRETMTKSQRIDWKTRGGGMGGGDGGNRTRPLPTTPGLMQITKETTKEKTSTTTSSAFSFKAAQRRASKPSATTTTTTTTSTTTRHSLPSITSKPANVETATTSSKPQQSQQDAELSEKAKAIKRRIAREKQYAGMGMGGRIMTRRRQPSGLSDDQVIAMMSQGGFGFGGGCCPGC